MAKRLNFTVPGSNQPPPKHHSNDSNDINTSVKYRSDVKCLDSQEETPPEGTNEVSGSAVAMSLDAEICAVCFKTCVNDEFLMRHMESVHALEDDSVVGCIICYEEFESYKDLMDHIKQHPKNCDKCQTKFSGHKQLLLHYRKVHAKNIRKKHKTCPDCLMKFDSKSGYLEHFARRHDAKICSRIKGKKNSTPLAVSQTDNNVNKLKGTSLASKNNQKINEKISDQKAVEDSTLGNRLAVKDLASPNKLTSENNHSKPPQSSAGSLNLKSSPVNSRSVTKTTMAKEGRKEEKMNGVCATPSIQVNTHITPPKISPPKSCEKKADPSPSDADKKLCGSACKKVFVESPDFAASLCPTLQSLSNHPKVLKTGNILPELLNLSASQRKSKRVIKKFEKSLHDLESSIPLKSVSSPPNLDLQKIENASVTSNVGNDPETSPSLSSSESSKIEKSPSNMKSNSAMKVCSPLSNSESKKIGKVPRYSDSSVTSDDFSSIKTEFKKVKTIIALPRKSVESRKIKMLSNSSVLTLVSSSLPSKSEVKLIENSPDLVEPDNSSEIISLPPKSESVKQRLHRAVITALPAKFLSKSVDEIAPELKLNGSSTTQSKVVSKKTETKSDDCAQLAVSSQVATPSMKSGMRSRPKRKASEGLSWKSLLKNNETASSEDKPCISFKSLLSKPELGEVGVPFDPSDPDYDPGAESEVIIESPLSKRPERPKRNLTVDLVSAKSEIPVESEKVESPTPEVQKASKRNIIVAVPSKSFARKIRQAPSGSKSNSDLTPTSSNKEEISPSSSEPDLVFEVSLASTPESQKKRGMNRQNQQVHFISNNDPEEIEEPEDISNEENVNHGKEVAESKVNIQELQRLVRMEMCHKFQSLGVTKDNLDAGTSQSCSLILPPHSDSAKIFPKNDKKIVSMEQCLKEFESKNKPGVVTKKFSKKGRKSVTEEPESVVILTEDNNSDVFKESSNLKYTAKKIKASKSKKQVLSVLKDFNSGDDAEQETFEATNGRDNTKNAKSSKLPSVDSVVDKNSHAKSKKNNVTKSSKRDSPSAGNGNTENILEKSNVKSSRNKQSINENRRKRKASETCENANGKLSKTLSSSHGNSIGEEPMEVSPSVNFNESELLSQSLPSKSFTSEPSKRRTSAKVMKNIPVEREGEEFQEEDLIQAIIDNLKQIKQSASNESESQRQSCPYCEYSSHRISALESHLKLNILIRPNYHRTLILNNSALFRSKDSKNSQVEDSVSASLVRNESDVAVTNGSAKEGSFDNCISSNVLTSTPHQTNDLLVAPVKIDDDDCPTPQKICKVVPEICNLNETACYNSFNSTDASISLVEPNDSISVNDFANVGSEDSIKSLNLSSDSFDNESESDNSEYSSIINSQPYVLLDDIGHLLPSVYERQSRENSDAENTPQKRNNSSASSEEKSLSYVDELFPEKEVTLETVCALCQEKFETNAELMSHILLHI